MYDLLIHSCSMVQAASSTNAYGVPAMSWTTGATTTSGIACRLMPTPLGQMQAEQAGGLVVSEYVLYLLCEDAPASLLAYSAEDTHRITAVLDSDGASVDAGPFDVLRIRDQAGEGHHLRLDLERVG